MDQTIPMTYRGREVGTAAMRREGLYCVVECRCEPVSDEVLRAYGHGGGRSLPLGVLVPEDGALHLRRRVALSRLPAEGLETVSVGDENPWQPWSGTCRGVALTGCRRGTRDGRAVELSKTEQRLLRALVENRGRTVSREVLVDRLWSDGGDFVEESALSVTVRRLRSKLEEDPSHPRYIRTVYGLGYTWADEP